MRVEEALRLQIGERYLVRGLGAGRPERAAGFLATTHPNSSTFLNKRFSRKIFILTIRA